LVRLGRTALCHSVFTTAYFRSFQRPLSVLAPNGFFVLPLNHGPHAAMPLVFCFSAQKTDHQLPVGSLICRLLSVKG
jgi:hypothetical protein